MRTRWRNESDRSNEHQLDLKQGRGALVDIEFLLQAIVLEHATTHPRLLGVTNSVDIVDAAVSAGLLEAKQASTLREAHALLLTRSLANKLDGRPRLVARDAALDQVCREVLLVARELDLTFDPPARTMPTTQDGMT
jgi:glutamate-ammonia-ligase adenylyltransferase